MELMITVMLHKMNDSAWSLEELNPIKDIEIMEVTANYSTLGAIITLSDNSKYKLIFRISMEEEVVNKQLITHFY